MMLSIMVKMSPIFFRAQNKLEPLAEKFYDVRKFIIKPPTQALQKVIFISQFQVMQGWESTCDGSYCYNGSTTRSVSITTFLFVIFAALRLR